ncbi:uncharacterized protein LOC123005159 [Tribolium madens]|uniref:uncharacterized protein LOC123005159 n=1 Tax=Tribolium madens TaxID=41895 RepID=UPI001CF7610B|nr:uncharacterized protein LOC123005159 [Tribolium madens]
MSSEDEVGAEGAGELPNAPRQEETPLKSNLKQIANSGAHVLRKLSIDPKLVPKPASRDEADKMIPGFFLMMVLIHTSESRGPHHPRGEAVVKHVHYRPTKTAPEKLMQDAELLHDKEHLQEHLEEIIKEPDLSKMTDEELEFYYFQVHDTDKNSKLDGLEILNAILHTTHEEKHEEGKETHSTDDFEYYVELIDRVLMEDDSDKDGYLSYPEYTSGRRNAIIAENRNQPSVKMVSQT